MAEFTKGPWKVNDDLSFIGKRRRGEPPNNDYAWIGFGEGGRQLLAEIDRRKDGCGNFRERALADARLIAAAPDLLAACEAFAKAFRAYELDNGDATLAHREMMKRGLAAIAAARGE